MTDQAMLLGLAARALSRAGLVQADAGVGLILSEEEARGRATWTGGIAERMWAYLTSGDQALLPPAS